MLQVTEVAWNDFQEVLGSCRDLFDLLQAHIKYLNRLQVVCLLNERSKSVAAVMQAAFAAILKLKTLLERMRNDWVAPSRDVSFDMDGLGMDTSNSGSFSAAYPQRTVQEGDLELLRQTHTAFEHYTGFLYNVLFKLHERGMEEASFGDLLNRLNFNNFFSLHHQQQQQQPSSTSPSAAS